MLVKVLDFFIGKNKCAIHKGRYWRRSVLLGICRGCCNWEALTNAEIGVRIRERI